MMTHLPTTLDRDVSQGPTPSESLEIHVHDRAPLPTDLERWEAFVARRAPLPLSYHPAWLTILERGLKQNPYCLEAVDGSGEVQGLLPLVFLNTRLFGRFLVGLSYLNYGGVLADDPNVAALLIDRALELAEQLDVRYLELRHEHAWDHPRLSSRSAAKVHMRLALPETSEALWSALGSKVRNQIRKGQKSDLEVTWGGQDQLGAFYEVFSRNMRDLGTPVFGLGLFRETVRQFPDRAEFCVVRSEGRPLASALLLHGWGITEVPSASSLRQFNHTNANMLMYWHLLERAIGRSQTCFDFGRSTPEGSTYRFKKQWGATPSPAPWQYYERSGDASEMQLENPRYQRLIRLWQRLPVGLTRLIGPPIVRGIP